MTSLNSNIAIATFTNTHLTEQAKKVVRLKSRGCNRIYPSERVLKSHYPALLGGWRSDDFVTTRTLPLKWSPPSCFGDHGLTSLNRILSSLVHASSIVSRKAGRRFGTGLSNIDGDHFTSPGETCCKKATNCGCANVSLCTGI